MMKDSQPIPSESFNQEQPGSVEAGAEQTTYDRDTKRFRVVKLRSRTPGLGRRRGSQRRIGRWDPPPRLLED